MNRTILLLALTLMLAESLPAADAPRFTWPGGRLSRDRAVELLAATGNPTALADGLDGTACADLPFLEGSYWQAVLALCAAFDLNLQAADHGQHQGAGPLYESTTLAVACGPVILTAGDGRFHRDRLVAHGPLLVELVDAGVFTAHTRQRRLSRALTALRVRLEPGYDDLTIGSAAVAWTRAESGSGESLLLYDPDQQGPAPGFGGQTRSAAPTVVTCYQVDPSLRSWRLHGITDIELLSQRDQTVDLRLGAEIDTHLGSLPISVWMIGKKTAAERGLADAGIGVSFPAGAIPSAHVEVGVTTADGTQLTCFGGHIDHDGNGRIYSYSFCSGLRRRRDYRVRVAATLREARLREPIQVTARLP